MLPPTAITPTSTTGQRILFYRLENNLTKRYVEKQTGVEVNSLYQYEKDLNLIPLNKLKKLAGLYNVDIQMLYDDYYSFLVYPYSERIKEIRKAHNLQENELATMLGITYHTIENWENGISKISRKYWEKFKALELI